MIDPKLAKARAKRQRKILATVTEHPSDTQMARKLKAAFLAKAVA